MNITSFRFSLLLLTGLIVLWVPSLAQENIIFTQADLLQDAKQLASILEKSHPDPYSNGGGKVAFQRRRQELLQNIPAEGLTAERFYRLLLPFVASLHDGHTAILPLQTGTQPRPGLPITFKIIDESLAVAGAVRKDNVDLRGALLLAVEGVPLPELIKRQNNLRGMENTYGTLALLSRSVGTERGLQNLLPEWTDLAKIGLTLRLATGESRDFFFQPGEKIENSPAQPNTKVRMPDMSRSDVAWNFLDKDGKTALLKIDDMSTYREACEAWIAKGMTEGPEMTRAAYQKFHGHKSPVKIEDVLAGIPAATDVFKDLVTAMKRAGTKNLIVDLRQNTGGNDLMVPMLFYFLFGRESMVSYNNGFQISRYSDLYFQVYANASLAVINRDRALSLEVGDYDFSGEQAYSKGNDPAALLKETGEYLKKIPTFFKVFSQGLYENFYRPPHLVALCSAWTYSSGFSMLAALEEFGATVVGTPSAHAGNNFGDSLLFQLTNTQLRGAVSYKQNITFPNDPEKGRCLRPDILLTHKKWAAFDFDPNAEMLLAIECLGGKIGVEKKTE